MLYGEGDELKKLSGGKWPMLEHVPDTCIVSTLFSDPTDLRRTSTALFRTVKRNYALSLHRVQGKYVRIKANAPA
jgi:hypothetical protein